MYFESYRVDTCRSPVFTLSFALGEGVGQAYMGVTICILCIHYRYKYMYIILFFFLALGGIELVLLGLRVRLLHHSATTDPGCVGHVFAAVVARIPHLLDNTH